ncbi:MAG: hypothetical protein V4694_06530 [Pseudomonadota bacterium]
MSKKLSHQTQERKSIQQEEPFSGDFISPLREYNESLDPESSAKFVRKNVTDFLGLVLAGATTQVPITIAISVGTPKSTGAVKTYSEAFRNLSEMSWKYVAKQSVNTLKYRGFSSFAPVTACNIIKEQNDLHPATVTVINTAAETAIASYARREAGAKFHSLNYFKYRFSDQQGKASNLLEINSLEKFNQLKNSTYNSSPNPTYDVKTFGEKEFNQLLSLQKVFNENRVFQAAALAFRNVIFSFGVFAARYISKKYVVGNFGDNLEKDFGIEKDDLEDYSTHSIRAGSAWFSILGDRPLSMASSGRMTSKQVQEQILKEIKTADVKALSSGATARASICFMAITAVAEGPNLIWKLVGNSEEKLSTNSKVSGKPNPNMEKPTAEKVSANKSKER